VNLRHCGTWRFALAALLLFVAQLACASELCHGLAASGGSDMATHPAAQSYGGGAMPMSATVTVTATGAGCCDVAPTQTSPCCVDAGPDAGIAMPAPSGLDLPIVAVLVPSRVVSAFTGRDGMSFRADPAPPSRPAYLRFLRFLR
jgi:hypothetical protein